MKPGQKRTRLLQVWTCWCGLLRLKLLHVSAAVAPEGVTCSISSAAASQRPQAGCFSACTCRKWSPSRPIHAAAFMRSFQLVLESLQRHHCPPPPKQSIMPCYCKSDGLAASYMHMKGDSVCPLVVVTVSRGYHQWGWKPSPHCTRYSDCAVMPHNALSST